MRERSANLIIFIFWGSLCLGLGNSRCLAADPSDDKVPEQVRSGLERYCFECHGDKKAKKDLRLNQFTTIESVLSEKRLWDRVLAHVRDAQMPPEDADTQLSSEEREVLLNGIESMLKEVDWDRFQRPGREMIARLTRREYRNTMRDLLGLDLHSGVGFVEDGEGESGFRNERASLAVEGAQVEKYLDAAERAVAGVMAVAFSPSSAKQIFVAEKMERSMVDRMKPHEGGMVLANPGQELSAEFDFPADGYYVVKLQADLMGKPTVGQIRVEGVEAAEVPVLGVGKNRSGQEGMMFVRKGRHRFSIENKNLFPQRRSLPVNVAALVIGEAKRNQTRLGPFVDESEILKKQRIEFNQQSWGAQEPFEWLRLLGVEGDTREIDRFRKYALQRGKGLAEERHKLAALARIEIADLDAIWEKQNQARLEDNAHLLERVASIKWQDWMGYQGKIHLKSMVIEGPVFPEEKKEELGRRNDENLLGLLEEWDRTDDASIKVVERFLSLAFRRKVGLDEKNNYRGFYREIRNKGEEPQEALRLTLLAILTAPEFLF